MTEKVSDLYQTPPYLFDRLMLDLGVADLVFDLAASEGNALGKYFATGPCTGELACHCGLCCRIPNGFAVFCNPPYSDVMPWVRRCRALGMHHDVALLLHFDPTTKWFQELVGADMGFRPHELRVPRQRISFIHPPECECKACAGAARGSNPRPSLIAIWSPNALGEPSESRVVWGWE